ncbi:tail fiber protein [Sphingomonas donggukensis]|uniref:Tail fiber protein n=1 Tax=Sphingomonas donggukensis TaxID=2949093 RepID=A0ABY4TUQ5_9SPHN|nr:tail fiber protein [Sphingomonas donggukensis]URW74899.1 tail fiber protein [Sphingomonas donggukensis]
MSEPYIGMIVYFGGTFNIRGYQKCQGQLLSIAQNTALFSILGTTYGGNGQQTFGLPDLRGRLAKGTGTGPGLTPVVEGQISGVETTVLNSTQLPAHNHPATFTNGASTLTANNIKGTSNAPIAGYQLARGIDGDNDPNALPYIYAPATPSTPVALGGVNVAGTVTVGVTGNNAPVPLLNPYLGLTALIAVEGIFPSRN